MRLFSCIVLRLYVPPPPSLLPYSGSMEGLLLSAGTSSSSSSGGVGGGGGGGGVEVVECYSRLAGVCHALRDSHCYHLRQFAGSARQHWQERLRERLARCVCCYA